MNLSIVKATRAYFWVLGVLVCMQLLHSAQASAANDEVRLQIHVIDAARGKGAPKVDKRLRALAKDLQSLPFSQFELVDAQSKSLSKNERVSLQFPGKKGEKRFLRVTNHGPQRGNKLGFQLQIPEMKFDTRVSVPNGGMILVGGPRHGSKTLVFAVSARAKPSAGSMKQRKRR